MLILNLIDVSECRMPVLLQIQWQNHLKSEYHAFVTAVEVKTGRRTSTTPLRKASNRNTCTQNSEIHAYLRYLPNSCHPNVKMLHQSFTNTDDSAHSNNFRQKAANENRKASFSFQDSSFFVYKCSEHSVSDHRQSTVGTSCPVHRIVVDSRIAGSSWDEEQLLWIELSKIE